MELPELSVPVVMAVAIWGGYGHLLKSYEILNRDRDRLIFGEIDGRKISVEHQSRILENDWKALHWGLILYLVIFGLLFVASAVLVKKTQKEDLLTTLCFVLSICPFLAAALFYLGYRDEYPYLRGIIDARALEDQTSKTPLTPPPPTSHPTPPDPTTPPAP